MITLRLEKCCVGSLNDNHMVKVSRRSYLRLEMVNEHKWWHLSKIQAITKVNMIHLLATLDTVSEFQYNSSDSFVRYFPFKMKTNLMVAL